jgi:Holliday junction resolvase RusA-like endonuclease
MIITYQSDDPVPLEEHPLELFVPGHARTKGSMKHLGNGHMVEQVKGSTAWRRLVAETIARDVFDQRSTADGVHRLWRPYPHAVAVGLYFTFAPQSGRKQPPPYPILRQYGDLDKLIRNVGDALIDGGLLVDDSQIIDVIARKRWTDLDEDLPGVSIRVFRPVEWAK